jgi:hypothetical protein
MTGKRVVVTGSRDCKDRDWVWEQLDAIHAVDLIEVLIHGNYRGLDRIADAWAIARGIKVERVDAEWTRYGARAGPMRNTRMIRDFGAVKCIKFDGGSGTADCAAKARAAGFEVVEVRGKA